MYLGHGHVEGPIIIQKHVKLLLKQFVVLHMKMVSLMSCCWLTICVKMENQHNPYWIQLRLYDHEPVTDLQKIIMFNVMQPNLQCCPSVTLYITISNLIRLNNLMTFVQDEV